jgi:hypothetical protein
VEGLGDFVREGGSTAWEINQSTVGCGCRAEVETEEDEQEPKTDNRFEGSVAAGYYFYVIFVEFVTCSSIVRNCCWCFT